MKQTIRHNIHTAYSLHDMRICSFDISEHQLTLHTQSGLIQIGEPCRQVPGSLRFNDVDWDVSYGYCLDFCGNAGSFHGEKKFLKDFLEQTLSHASLEVTDETFGYNQSHFSGYLSVGSDLKECFIHIYHQGDMVYVTEE